MVNIRKIREVVEMPCPCNAEVNQLLSQINTPSQNLGSPNLGNFLQNLGIFDLQNVFVCCLDLQIANNSISITNLNNPFSCINSSGQQFGHRQIVSSAGVYIVIGNSCKLGCDKRSNIIYIGSTGNLQNRINNDFINELRYNNQRPVHSGARKIKKAILINNISQTCLYIIGFPIQSQVQNQYQGIWEKAEGCFQADYRHFYLIDPCFVDQTKDPDFTIFQSISPNISHNDARRTIQFILTTIDIFFRDCIQAC